METVSAIQQAAQGQRPLAGSKGDNRQRQNERTRGATANGFLNHRFLPVWNSRGGDWQQMEREFFNSLSNLCKLYRWRQPDVSGLEFPTNVWKAHQLIREECKKRNLDCMIVADGHYSAVVTTVSTYDTGYTLYYIPMKPLWMLLGCPRQKQLAACILELFRYLAQVSSVALCEDGSYVASEYETLENWIKEADEDGYREKQLADLSLFTVAHTQVNKLLKKRFAFKRLERSVAGYQHSVRDADIDRFLTGAVDFCRDYPARSIADTIDYISEGEQNERIYLEQYLSFYWSGNDRLHETLVTMVSDELQECGWQQEPVSLQCFDQRQKSEHHDFTYEQRFFKLVNSLTELLNDYENEEHYEQL